MNAPTPSSNLQSRLTCVIVFSLNKCTSSLSDLLFWLETSSSELEVGGGSYAEVKEAVRTSRLINFFIPNGENTGPAEPLIGYTNQFTSALILENTETLNRLSYSDDCVPT